LSSLFRPASLPAELRRMALMTARRKSAAVKIQADGTAAFTIPSRKWARFLISALCQPDKSQHCDPGPAQSAALVGSVTGRPLPGGQRVCPPGADAGRRTGRERFRRPERSADLRLRSRTTRLSPGRPSAVGPLATSTTTASLRCHHRGDGRRRSDVRLQRKRHALGRPVCYVCCLALNSTGPPPPGGPPPPPPSYSVVALRG